MDTYYTIEEKYLQAVDELSYDNPKALNILNEIIITDPLYARAHYQLGKLYYYELKDYQAAGYYFKTCAELEPLFPDVYYHYLNLVVFMKMEAKVNEVSAKALTVPGVDAASVYYLLGLFNEKTKQWAKALQAYRIALLEATCNKQREDIEENITRVRSKIAQTNTYQYHMQE